MFDNTVRHRYITVLVNYEDHDVIHHEVRTVDCVTGRDNRMSDYKFDNTVYPSTTIKSALALPFVIERAKNSLGWRCVSRMTGNLVASFAEYDDALAFAKMRASENNFENKIIF